MVAPEPTSRLIAELPSASRRLLDTVTQLPDDAVLRPSLLPGWSVGHVLSHVARNADALVNLCDWARTGVRKPMYVSMEARESDIADGAGRPVPEQVQDIADTQARLLERFEDLPTAAWAAEVTWPSGAVRAAAQVVTARLCELEVHHVDLGLGYTFDDVPVESRDVLLSYATSRWPSGFGVALRSTDSPWVSPEHPADARILTGGSAALLSWVLGRSDGSELGGDMPQAPPWG
ncbi:maleylpyruvate isomerase family mycothiol-dependent enzyme [Kribbella sp. NBC_00382]|uniref:maleylpyruvate isomerase family mycothiol-dependent enzyme n=1 Tax=Kribbella sp. NBC_00382 TaxID=2975967 RepID=UPI002E22CF22